MGVNSNIGSMVLGHALVITTMQIRGQYLILEAIMASKTELS